MAFTLEQVVPWGRSFDEYRRMFALSPADLQRTILGCADGPASFNAEATVLGLSVTSADPLYRFDAISIRQRIEATAAQMIDQTRLNAHQFVWDAIGSVEELERIRMGAMLRFLDDFEAGKRARRYVDAELPALPFEDGVFDLALCSHFLFLYSDQLIADFHCAAIAELCRVAREVRVFPLLALGGRPSAHVAAVSDHVRGRGWTATIERVPYEFQRGGNEMLRLLPAAVT